MSDTVSPEVAAIRIRLLDDAHIAWVAAQNECSEALHAWFEAPRYDRAYHAHLAAFNREEAAALDLQRLSEVADRCRATLAAERESSACPKRNAEQRGGEKVSVTEHPLTPVEAMRSHAAHGHMRCVSARTPRTVARATQVRDWCEDAS